VSRSAHTLEHSYGELEWAVLEVLWEVGADISVREAQQALRRPLAYTTILTVLDRLHAKGAVLRSREGKAYVYRARFPREAFLGERAVRALAESGRPADTVLMAFLDSAEVHDPELLDRLARLIEEKRRGR
jgi:predicted transcriptional regulator